MTKQGVAKIFRNGRSQAVRLPRLFFFQAEDGIRDIGVNGVKTCALPIYPRRRAGAAPNQPTSIWISALARRGRHRETSGSSDRTRPHSEQIDGTLLVAVRTIRPTR